MFNNDAAEFIYYRTYSRWRDDLGRRENWPETVDRYMDYIQQQCDDRVPLKVFKKIKEKILNMDALPSMRLLWAAGKAAESSNCCGYNCSFLNIDSVDSFAECLYLLCCGCGVGFSVEKRHINKLPDVPALSQEDAAKILNQEPFLFVVPDSKEGWADSIKIQMNNLYQGRPVKFDYSLIRKQGDRLKTMGGRASGPAPLINLHDFVNRVFEEARGRKLKPIECHDIVNKIGEIVVAGGTRRSAEISLSDLSDDEMAKAKLWPFPVHRAMSNNSAVYLEKPTAVRFLEEWSILAKSGTGERGIFNLQAARENAPERREGKRIEGENPCGEIALRNMQFCNLSTVVVRSDDDLDDLLEKVETATWIGAIQSSLTDFPYLRKSWKKNCDEERLLGVSITGQMDNPKIFTKDTLLALKKKAIKVAKHAAKILKINTPTAITCVKPEGTVSQLANTSSGVHPRYSEYYIRRYRISSSDPLLRLMKAQGINLSPENGQRKSDWDKADDGDIHACSIYQKGKKWTEDKVNTWVVSFPIKAPKESITRDKFNEMQQLEWVKMVQENWAEHSVSATIYVKDDQWFNVGNWVYNHWDKINGLSFLPYDGGKYEQAPYEEISKEQYEELTSQYIKIDYSLLSHYEKEDNTTGAKSLACSGGACEIN